MLLALHIWALAYNKEVSVYTDNRYSENGDFAVYLFTFLHAKLQMWMLLILFQSHKTMFRWHIDMLMLTTSRLSDINLYHSLGKFNRWQIDHIFPRKYALIFHANCLLKSQSLFSEKKIRKIFQNVVCWNFYLEWLVLNKCSVQAYDYRWHYLCHVTAQQAHDIYTTSAQCRRNVMTLRRRWGDVVFTSCARWMGTTVILIPQSNPVRKTLLLSSLGKIFIGQHFEKVF